MTMTDEQILVALREAAKGRHQGTQQLLLWFDFERLTGLSRNVGRMLCTVAIDMAEMMEDGPELVAGLRKLLESKDCFVRQAILDGAKS